jgi:hypothetical protein
VQPSVQGTGRGTGPHPRQLPVTLAVPDEVQQWSMITLRQRLANIGGRIFGQCQLIADQLAEVTVSRSLFRHSLAAIAALRNACRPMLRIGATAGPPEAQRETRVRMTGLGRKTRRATHHRSASGAPALLGSVSSLPTDASDSYHQFGARGTDDYLGKVEYARDAGLFGK